ncbi:prepilin-type N-terminal cleavage/methylation domain-containing protein [Thermodesulfobacteriota bacterium]
MHESRGFSLLEVLLGISIFMIGMLGVTALNISSLKSNTFSGNLTEATLIAATKIEELMTMEFDDIKDTDGDGTNQDTNDDGLDNIGGGNFGLDDSGAGADFPEGPLGKNKIYMVYWNVAVNEPISVDPLDPVKTKTINVIVEWYVKEEPRRINMQIIRMKD